MHFEKKVISLILILFLFFFGTEAAYAQTGTIRGFVYEKETGEPVIFTNVYLHKTSLGAATDVNGYFVISKIPPGSYTLMVTYLGFDTLQIPITIKQNEVITEKLYLVKGTVTLDVFNVSAEREEAKTETKISVVKITPKQIKQIPTIGGQPDLAQYLQVLPGVIFTGDQGGQLYIRGGSPIQNKVLLDGMIIYNPFHSIGLFSVFDTDIIRNADIYTGGFGAEYGGRISSVMDITTRDGNKSRLSGKVGVTPFGARTLLEGPIFKEKEGNESSASFILSVKNSYLMQTSKVFYNYIDTGGLPFNYTDIYGKISINAGNGSKVNFFGFNFTDEVQYLAISDFHWNSYGAGSNFIIVPGISPMLMEGNIAFSQYEISLTDKSTLPRYSIINGFNLGFGFKYFEGKNVISYGIEVLGFKTDFNFYNQVNRLIQQEENTTEISGYFKYKISAGRWLIEPSFRAHYYASLSNFSPEPRLALKFLMLENLRLKFAGGLYSQNLISATSDRDVVNLFYGFISGPDNLPKKFDDKEITHKLQKAEHLIFGVEIDIKNYLTINAETYYKNFSQLTNLNRNKVFDDSPEYLDKPEYLRKDFIIEVGDAYGFDFSLKYDYKRVYFWAVYSLGYVNRYDGIINYVTHYDRRHNINLVGSYIFGKNNNWEVNSRWNYGSGFPFTQSQGFYEFLTFPDGINTDYTTTNGELGTIYGELNTGRLPYYHRLDLTLKKVFKFKGNVELETNLSITNVYNRKNIFYFDRIKFERVDQLPFMPSVGINFSF